MSIELSRPVKTPVLKESLIKKTFSRDSGSVQYPYIIMMDQKNVNKIKWASKVTELKECLNAKPSQGMWLSSIFLHHFDGSQKY